MHYCVLVVGSLAWFLYKCSSLETECNGSTSTKVCIQKSFSSCEEATPAHYVCVVAVKPS